MIYHQFNLQKQAYEKLSPKEKKVLEILKETVLDMAKVYEAQVKDGFYPPGITKEQLEKAAKKEPLILSPFTYVYLEDAKLKAIFYHQKYAYLLQPIAEKIEKAAKISSNRSFKKYLQARAKSLLDGSYREADIAWFNVKNSLLDFSIGPFERYLDKIMFLKRVFQAHVGIVDCSLTEQAREIKETLYISARISHDQSHSVDIPKKGVDVVVEKTPATAGYMADVLFSGEHFPSDLNVMQKYGSKILLYLSQMRLKFEKLHYPIFKMIFDKRFASKYSKELLFRATGWNTLLYELGRQLHKFTGARERLQELYGPVDEANGFASGIQHAKHLVVKGLISQEELEAIIIIHIVWMFADWLQNQHNKSMTSYVSGNSILLNSYLESGALKEQKGISWPNFSKIFFEIETLADILVSLLKEGTYEETSKFIKENANPENFARLSKNLMKLKVNI